MVGTVAAWFVERTDLPGRRIWAVLLVIPLGIPDFVVSFGWRAIFPAFGGFWAAALVMTLAVYPLVFLPVAASLRNADPAQEEVARSLGLGRLRTFWRVTVGQARLAILGGSVLVGLVVLAEFGAFEILGFRTLTTEIYTEFTVGFNQPARLRPLADPRRAGRPAPGREAWSGAGAGRRASGAERARQIRPGCSAGRARPCWPASASLVVLALGRAGGRHHLPHGPRRQLDAAAGVLGTPTAHTFGYAGGRRCHGHRRRVADRPALGPLPRRR